MCFAVGNGVEGKVKVKLSCDSDARKSPAAKKILEQSRLSANATSN